MAVGQRKGSDGGNAHDRAVRRGTQARKSAEDLVDIVPDSQSQSAASADPKINEWKQPLNRADSIGLLVGIVGTLFILITPSVWQKVPALLLLCFGYAYFIWLSHWTHGLGKIRASVIVAGVALMGWWVVPQLLEQWHVEHMRSELTFEANLPGVGSTDGNYYGLKWSKDLVDARLKVISEAKFPIQNLRLEVWPVNKPGEVLGMAQVDQDRLGCVIRKPRKDYFPPTVFREKDGSRIDVAPFANDTMNSLSMARDHYDLLCDRIQPEESIPLVLGILPQYTGRQSIPSSEFHIKGEYETTASEGNKRIPVDEIVPISTLPSWK